MIFEPRIETVGRMPREMSHVDLIKNEPMLFNCDGLHALEFGGPLTREFLCNLPADWLHVPLVIDSKVVMLMRGWWPCIPGWHHDDVERRGPFNQPDYVMKNKRAEFIMCIVGTDPELCRTQFLTAPVDLPVPPEGATVYQEWDRMLNANQDFLDEHKRFAQDREVLFFDDATFHRGTAATGSGWRWFCRVSRYYDAHGNPIDRGNVRTNEVRSQVQVYVKDEGKGW